MDQNEFSDYIETLCEEELVRAIKQTFSEMGEKIDEKGKVKFSYTMFGDGFNHWLGSNLLLKGTLQAKIFEPFEEACTETLDKINRLVRHYQNSPSQNAAILVDLRDLTSDINNAYKEIMAEKKAIMENISYSNVAWHLRSCASEHKFIPSATIKKITSAEEAEAIKNGLIKAARLKRFSRMNGFWKVRDFFVLYSRLCAETAAIPADFSLLVQRHGIDQSDLRSKSRTTTPRATLT